MVLLQEAPRERHPMSGVIWHFAEFGWPIVVLILMHHFGDQLGEIDLFTARELTFIALDQQRSHKMLKKNRFVFGVASTLYARKQCVSLVQYILWYGKSKDSLKFRNLYLDRIEGHTSQEFSSGGDSKMSKFKNGKLVR